MSLHTPRNNDRDQKSFTHNWQENYYEIQAWLQKNYQAMLNLLTEIKRGDRPFTEQADPDENEVFIPGPPGRVGDRGPAGQVVFLEGGESGEDAIPIPGPKGADGAVGANSTVPGPAIYLEPEGPDEPLLMPGARGADGAASTVPGPAGAFVYLEPNEPEDVPFIPGTRGVDGAAGATGPSGSVVYLEPNDPEDTFMPGPIGQTSIIPGPVGQTIYEEPDEPEAPLIVPGPIGATGLQGIQGPASGISIKSAIVDVSPKRKAAKSGTLLIESTFNPSSVGKPVIVHQAPSNNDEEECVQLICVGEIISPSKLRVRWISLGGPVRGMKKFNILIGA